MKSNKAAPFKPNLWIFLVVTLICYGYSVAVRYQQKMVWEENPSHYFVDGSPMMTTLDSYYWLRLAKEIDQGLPGENDSLRNFPDGKKLEAPLISVLIAAIAPLFDNNFYRAGFYLMIFLSGLFIFPLAIYFYSIGYPMTGLLGGVIGSISHEYLIRTGIGRIDTDALILFFLFSASALVLKASQTRILYRVLVYSGLTGIAVYLLTEWWGKSVFVIPFAATLCLAMLLSQNGYVSEDRERKKVRPIFQRLITWRQLRVVSLTLVVFMVCASGFEIRPLRSLDFLKKPVEYAEQYLGIGAKEIETSDTAGKSATKKTTFPSVLQTITEARRLPIETSLAQLLRSPALSAVGLIGFLFFFVFHWKKLIPLLPVFAVGLLVFYSARRFGMFLGPFVGIGYGYLLTVLLGFMFWCCSVAKRKSSISKTGIVCAFAKFPPKTLSHSKELLNYGCAGLCFIFLSTNTWVGHAPPPSVPVSVFRAFSDLKNRLPTDSALYTWWDYGYALTEITDRATFHDGGSQMSPKTYFIAQSLVSDSQNELYNTVSFLTKEGRAGIHRLLAQPHSDGDIFDQVLSNPPVLEKENVFVVYTNDLIGKYAAIHSIGHWDSVSQRPGPSSGYRNLKCNQLKGFELRCQIGNVDLIRDSVIGRTPLKQALIVADGYVQRRIQYPRKQGKYLQVLLRGKELVSVQIVSKSVFLSNFNQMFLLGKYDETLFKQHYIAFPWVRAFEVRSAGQHDNTEQPDSN